MEARSSVLFIILLSLHICTGAGEVSELIPSIISGMVNSTMHEISLFQNPMDKSGCSSLLNEVSRRLKKDAARLISSERKEDYDELATILSAGMTSVHTCLHEFGFSVKLIEASKLQRISHLFSNSLAVMKKISGEAVSSQVYGNQGFPSLFQAAAPVINVTVAKDGSGNFTTITAALRAAPNRSTTRFVIHIKAGVYLEYIEIGEEKPMVTLLGDGIGKTVIKGGRNANDGWKTFWTATVGISGRGFMARGITFENYAGPYKEMAVALRVNADVSAFYQCSFLGYQDTLYVHSWRQFFRECDIYWTVDFIFGDSAVVFQQCNIYARRPKPNQFNAITAQGRQNPNHTTGISMINCRIAAAPDLIPVVSSVKSYLGRPWKEYSRTVIMLSDIGDLIQPAGWARWNVSNEATLYYGEYKNRGPGSGTAARVTWPGYRVITTDTVASRFTVRNFIQGTAWLPATGIPFYPNLTP